MRRQTTALASGTATADALTQFTSAYEELSALDSSVVDESGALVADFYRDTFAPALQEAIGISVGWRSLVPAGDAALYLQRHYIVDSEDAVGLIDDAGDGSTWSEVHRDLHLGLYETTLRLGADDIYFIEPESGIIVYSASKKADFATSLDVGPHSGSTLATVMRLVREAPEKGTTTLIDMAPYTPDLGSPMMFIASPVFDGDQLAGIFVVKISSAPIDAIMTAEGNWAGEEPDRLSRRLGDGRDGIAS
jgi:hypothetical protein